MLRVGLTGGIGAGKTTVSEKFREFFDVPVLDADKITRTLMQPGSEAFIEIIELFGKEAATGNGEIDRSFLREIVFSEPSKRQKLEEIIHPKVRMELAKEVGQLTCNYCLIVIPLLIESNMQTVVDRILVIDTLKSNQIERVTIRDNCSRKHVNSILDAQIDPLERLRYADDIISNNGSMQDLDSQIHQLHEKYMALSG